MSNQIPVHNVTPPAKKPAESTDLYAAREKIYTRAFTGLFRNLARAVGKSYLDSRARLGFPMAPKQHAEEVLAELAKAAEKQKKAA